MLSKVHIIALVAGAGALTAHGSGAAAEAFSPRPLAAITELPREAVQPVLAKFPRGALVSHASCSVGTGLFAAYALVITEAGNANLRSDQVRAAAVVKAPDGWKLEVMPDEIHVPGLGSQRGLFEDFLKEGSVSQPIEVKCANPGRDDRLSPKVGKWLVKQKELRGSQHLCFAISDTYNNWVCYAYDAKRGTLVPSFAQLQAD